MAHQKVLHEESLRALFESCVDSCADSIYRVAFRLTGNQTLASELVQETYLNAWKSIGSLKQKDRMRSWIFSILRNQYTKLLKAEKKIPIEMSVAEPIATEETSDEITRSRQAALQEAIGSLPEQQRIPILLCSMEGLTVDEAAEVLGWPRGTVLSRLHRGKQKLKDQLLRTYDEHDSPQNQFRSHE